MELIAEHPAAAGLVKQRTLYDHHLTAHEIDGLDTTAALLRARFDSVETPEFAAACALAAHDLPYSLRELAYRFKQLELPCGVVRLRGIPVDDTNIGPSPAHWDAAWVNPPSLLEEIRQCLLTALLGDLFGWRTQENGRFLRHIVPVKKDAGEQLGGSSKVTLVWHNEEAFHQYRCDFLSIMCYRNEEAAETLLCCIDDIDIPDAQWQVLSAPRFQILPDTSHLPEQNVSSHWRLDDGAFARIRQMHLDPQPVPVLTGARNRPFIQVDEAYMRARAGDTEAADALAWLIDAFYQQRSSVVMQPGDLIWVDNKRTVHGRAIYQPNYGPRQRWLRRVNVHANLRDTLPFRQGPRHREIL
ncbi:TauD/TfdA family dioxygenase [Andreprevotia chitinilytica]|uniref:TauD/TfdA family dioxygenase n=1 Tax=Andreprevotia chitinilytica TaxID=396808 RepID=UPI00054F61E2|nr:TauD/TfdA family dioxygenase [Andreprevotia chitinilytica]